MAPGAGTSLPLNIHSSGMLNVVSGKEFPTSRKIVAPSSSGSSTPKEYVILLAAFRCSLHNGWQSTN